MLDLPILNVRLQPCHEDWQQMTPVAQGYHCASCQRTVLDFTDATQSDLEAARAASPDGRLCGRFRAAQLAPPPRLRPRLRQFLVALVLVCGLGLTSQEAWAQVQCFGSSPPTHLVLHRPQELNPAILAVRANVLPTFSQRAVRQASLRDLPAQVPEPRTIVFGMVGTEPMPSFPGGQDSLVAYLKRNLRYPASTTVEGKVFVSFVITQTGHITQAKVLKGVNPILDAEALRVVRQMPRWIQPSQQHTVEVSYTLPITFMHK